MHSCSKTGQWQMKHKRILSLTHVGLCFPPRRSSTHAGEADVVVGPVLRRAVSHGWSWGFGLTLRPLTRTSMLPWGESRAGLPTCCGVLGRGSGSLGGTHGRKSSSCSSGSGGLTGKSWSTCRKSGTGRDSEQNNKADGNTNGTLCILLAVLKGIQ